MTIHDPDYLDAGVPSDEAAMVCEVLPRCGDDVEICSHISQMMQLQFYNQDGSLTEWAQRAEDAVREALLYGTGPMVKGGLQEITMGLNDTHSTRN